MALPSGTFYDANGGLLQVIFSRTYDSIGPGYIDLVCRIKDGGGTVLALGELPSDLPATDSITLAVIYPGGTAWTVEMVEVGHSVSSTGVVSVTTPSIICNLYKK